MAGFFTNSAWLDQIHQQIDTPALLIDEWQLNKNISDMQDLANKNGVRLRPHFKTHKCLWIARKQTEKGAAGITVAKPAEAELLAGAGFADLFIANQVTQSRKLDRLVALNKKTKLSVGIDHPDQVNMIQTVFSSANQRLHVLVEIDSGLQRCGIPPGKKLIDLVQQIESAPALVFSGIFTHAGQVYGAKSEEEVRKTGEYEALIMHESAQSLRKNGIEVKVISVGSTPTVPYSAAHPSVTEIRPGNYVFYDNIQYALGCCRPDQWALAVLATVISQPAPRRIVTDAGSKALNLDRGAHARSLIKGYGRLLNIRGEIVRLSEEHGIVELEKAASIKPGSPVLIIPNHACAVTNLFSHVYFVNPNHEVKKMAVDARGMSQ
jgi:D-serine deaminase-like pyridoxal phosphate-dependent protein